MEFFNDFIAERLNLINIPLQIGTHRLASFLEEDEISDSLSFVDELTAEQLEEAAIIQNLMKEFYRMSSSLTQN